MAVVVDLGTGAFSNLIRYRSPDTLDALVITHMHADHFLDTLPLRYALKYGERTNGRKLPLYLPPTGEAMLRRLCSAFAKESGDDFLADVFDVRTYDPTLPLRCGTAVVRFAPADHFIPTFAVRCDVAGASVAFSSDTAPVDSVVKLARGARLFVCEATLNEAEESEAGRGHMSAREAGAMAARAVAERLVITHYTEAASPEDLAARARLAFTGDVDVADDGYRIEF